MFMDLYSLTEFESNNDSKLLDPANEKSPTISTPNGTE